MKKTNGQYQYFEIKASHHQYKGERYFKFKWGEDHCIQVCKFVGDTKKGKSNTIGIYLIHYMTFLSNYLGIGYAIPCKKEKYDREFDKLFKALKNPKS